MSQGFAAPALDAITHYLERCRHLLRIVSDQPSPEDLLATRIAADGFDTAMHLAIAIQFAARAVCPPAGLPVPELPDRLSVEGLADYHRDVATLLEEVAPDQLCRLVDHTAGEASLTQDPADYVLRFALPNMIFHMSMSYAALRASGVAMGKADFDGLHRY